MKKPVEIRFLEFLEPKNGIEKEIEIQKFVDENLQDIEIQEPIADFLNGLKQKDYIALTGDRNFKVGWKSLQPNEKSQIKAKIKISGKDYLYSYRNNQSIKNILNRQTLIFLFTGIFALGTLIISIINLNSDKKQEQSQIKLQQQSNEIQALRNQLLQFKIDSTLSAKKNRSNLNFHYK